MCGLLFQSLEFCILTIAILYVWSQKCFDERVELTLMPAANLVSMVDLQSTVNSHNVNANFG